MQTLIVRLLKMHTFLRPFLIVKSQEKRVKLVTRPVAAKQRAQLSMGKDEMANIDDRIVELQERLARKRLMNQQLASQISAATSAKQAQLRAIQQGMQIKNKNKPGTQISNLWWAPKLS